MPPSFPLHFQGAVLGILPQTVLQSLTGLSPCSVLRSSRLQIRKTALRKVRHTTSPLHYCRGFSLNCAAFSRWYSQHPNWFRFLQVLRRFNSLRSLAMTGPSKRRLIRTSPVQSLRATRRSISLLVTSFFGVSNRVIPLAAYQKCARPAYGS